jgi:hypothetical protein
MHLNSVQRLLSAATVRCYADGKWLVFVKPRKVGSSTFFTGVMTQHACFRRGCYAAVVAHKRKVAQELAMVAIRFHHSMPAEIRPRKTPGLKRSLELPDIDSKLDIASVKDDEPLRGSTGIQALLTTEISSWAEEAGENAWVSTLSNVPKDEGFVVAESTPKHRDDQLHKLWVQSDDPDSKWQKVFAPWTFFEDYAAEPPPSWNPSAVVADYAHRHGLTPQQAFWMQTDGLANVGGNIDRFRAEFPINEVECWTMTSGRIFNTDILAEILASLDGGTAMANEPHEYAEFKEPEKDHKYLIFCDPAGSWAERDMHGVEIVDIEGCSQVAEYLGHENAFLHARRLADLGMRYNRAIIYVEANGVGEAVLSHLVDGLRYPNVFHRPKDEGGKPGWWSSQSRKAEAVSKLDELVNDRSIQLRSRRGINQLIDYRGQWDKLARDASDGHYDLAAALCGAAWAWRNEVGGRYTKRIEDPRAVVERWWKNFLSRTRGQHAQENNTPWGKHL